MINGLLNRKKNRVNIRKLIDDDGNIANTPAAIADNFNEYFANIATNLKTKIQMKWNNTMIHSNNFCDNQYKI